MVGDSADLAAVTRAVDQVLARVLTAEITRAEAVARIVALTAEQFIASTPAERTEAEAEQLLTLFDQRGGGRDAAMIVAAQVARDRRDPAEVYRIAQRVRALVRRRKKNAEAAFRPRDSGEHAADGN